MRFLSFLMLAGCLSAADVAVWRTGPGTIGTAPALAGSSIADGQEFAAGERPVRVALVRAPATTFILAPGARLRLMEKGADLHGELLAGIVEAHVADKGPYAQVHVQGASLNVQVTGTLFMVERVTGDTDYVALIEGRVKVSLREQVVAALGRDLPAIELGPRQGLEGSSAGFGGIESLAVRPTLPITTAARTVREQSSDPAPEETTTTSAWTPTELPPDVTAEVTPPVEVAPLPLDSITTTVVEEVRQQVSESISTGVSEAIQQQVQDQVVESVISAPGILGAPPGPPVE